MVQRGVRFARRTAWPERLATSALVAMVCLAVYDRAFAQAQTQDGINWTLTTQVADVTRRIDHIESMVQSIVVGVFVNLVAFVGYVLKQKKIL